MAIISDHLFGRKIIEQFPIKTKIKKTWKERLSSWPWKPWVKYRYEYKEFLQPGQVFMFGNNMIMNPATKNELKKSFPLISKCRHDHGY